MEERKETILQVLTARVRRQRGLDEGQSSPRISPLPNPFRNSLDDLAGLTTPSTQLTSDTTRSSQPSNLNGEARHNVHADDEHDADISSAHVSDERFSDHSSAASSSEPTSDGGASRPSSNASLSRQASVGPSVEEAFDGQAVEEASQRSNLNVSTRSVSRLCDISDTWNQADANAADNSAPDQDRMRSSRGLQAGFVIEVKDTRLEHRFKRKPAFHSFLSQLGAKHGRVWYRSGRGPKQVDIIVDDDAGLKKLVEYAKTQGRVEVKLGGRDSEDFQES